jgi:hypothetical protein
MVKRVYDRNEKNSLNKKFLGITILERVLGFAHCHKLIIVFELVTIKDNQMIVL